MVDLYKKNIPFRNKPLANFKQYLDHLLRWQHKSQMTIHTDYYASEIMSFVATLDLTNYSDLGNMYIMFMGVHRMEMEKESRLPKKGVTDQ